MDKCLNTSALYVSIVTTPFSMDDIVVAMSEQQRAIRY